MTRSRRRALSLATFGVGLPGLAGLAGLAARPAPAAPPTPAKPAAPMPAPGPEARVGGYRVSLERVQENENFWYEWDENAPSNVGGRNTLSLFLVIHPPTPQLAANIEGLDPRFLAFSPGNRPVNFQSYSPDDGDPLTTGVWRTCLVAGDLDNSVTELRKIQGELLVYPKAKTVTADFPLTAKTPATQNVDGLKVTLKQVVQRPNVLTAVIAVEWSGPASLARVNTDAMYGITALSRTDAVILPNGGGSSSAATRGTVSTRDYKISFLDVAKGDAAPAKLRFQNVFRSGPLQRLAFNLGDLPLPDTLAVGAVGGRAAVDLAGPLQPPHPLHAANGGALVLDTGTNGSSDEELFPLGLSRKESAGWGPWRWIDVAPTAGKLTLRRVLPGRYRVVLANGSSPQEAEILTGKETRLTFPRGNAP